MPPPSTRRLLASTGRGWECRPAAVGPRPPRRLRPRRARAAVASACVRACACPAPLSAAARVDLRATPRAPASLSLPGPGCAVRQRGRRRPRRLHSCAYRRREARSVRHAPAHDLRRRPCLTGGLDSLYPADECVRDRLVHSRRVGCCRGCPRRAVLVPAVGDCAVPVDAVCASRFPQAPHVRLQPRRKG
eukprot:3620762-Pleurochrysis_carterae.AAC.1